MMSPTGSAIASPPSEPSCYEDRPAEDDDVDLGVPDPVHRLVGARDVRGAVTVAGAAFERGRVDGRLDDLGKSSVHLKNLTRGGRKCVLVRPTYCLPTRQASSPVRRCTPLQGHALS